MINIILFFRCRIFQQLPAQCTLVLDPNDRCCYQPRCTATGTNIPLNPYYNTHNGSSNVTPKPGQLNVVPLGQYNVISGNNWLKPGQGLPYTGGNKGKYIYMTV
jgi:hypothetical protein